MDYYTKYKDFGKIFLVLAVQVGTCAATQFGMKSVNL